MSRPVATQRIYVDADGNPVDENDPRAAYLACAEGRPIPDELLARLDPPPEADHEGPDPDDDSPEDRVDEDAGDGEDEDAAASDAPVLDELTGRQLNELIDRYGLDVDKKLRVADRRAAVAAAAYPDRPSV